MAEPKLSYPQEAVKILTEIATANKMTGDEVNAIAANVEGHEKEFVAYMHAAAKRVEARLDAGLPPEKDPKAKEDLRKLPKETRNAIETAEKKESDARKALEKAVSTSDLADMKTALQILPDAANDYALSAGTAAHNQQLAGVAAKLEASKHKLQPLAEALIAGQDPTAILEKIRSDSLLKDMNAADQKAVLEMVAKYTAEHAKELAQKSLIQQGEDKIVEVVKQVPGIALNMGKDALQTAATGLPP